MGAEEGGVKEKREGGVEEGSERGREGGRGEGEEVRRDGMELMVTAMWRIATGGVSNSGTVKCIHTDRYSLLEAFDDFVSVIIVLINLNYYRRVRMMQSTPQ